MFIYAYAYAYGKIYILLFSLQTSHTAQDLLLLAYFYMCFYQCTGMTSFSAWLQYTSHVYACVFLCTYLCVCVMWVRLSYSDKQWSDAVRSSQYSRNVLGVLLAYAQALRYSAGTELSCVCARARARLCVFVFVCVCVCMSARVNIYVYMCCKKICYR